MYIKMTTGEVFKTLIDLEDGSWIISCEHPNAPIYVNRTEIDAGERVEAPGINSQGKTNELSTAAVKRLEVIKPLLDNNTAITNEIVRRKIADSCAVRYGTTRKRVMRLYYRYLATGVLVSSRKREKKKQPEFDKAIRTYYFSAKKHSLRTTYELMVLDAYCDGTGKVIEDVPTFSAFRQYYYRRYSKSKQKDISREGLTKYQRDSRMLYGSAMAYRDKIGSYQIDETTADIYLVSDYDRSKVIGRPNIYMATDTVTGVITGLYIGFDAGETALMKCIANASTDKTEHCHEYGIDIAGGDWPCVGLPSEIICDRGQEFVGKRTEELCRRYGVIINSTPPFRAEEKPLIERVIGLIQDTYKSMLQGRGIINGDAQERWAIDYRKQAVLTLEEYTKIVITAVITLNKSRVLEDIGHLPADAPHTPLALWGWFMEQGKSNLLTVEAEELYVISLPRTTATITRTGINYNNLRYVPDMGSTITVGSKVTIGYDTDRVNNIYIVNADGYIKCTLAENCNRYSGRSLADVKIMKQIENADIKKAKSEELECRIQMRRQIIDIIDKAESEKSVCRR